MAADDVDLTFGSIGEAGLRQWVEANPRRVNERDSVGYTPLHVAALVDESVPLVLWLVKEKGADVNAIKDTGHTSAFL